MSKLFNWAAARLVAAFALALPLAATAAPTATAVWRSNLGQSYTIGGNTYAVTPRDGTLNQDGTITVSSTWGDKAPYIDLEGANVGIVSVLVKYSGLDISQIYGTDGDCVGVAFASIIDSDNNVVGSCVQKVNGVANNTVRAYHCGASAASATPRDIGSMTAVEGSGYLLFAFKDSQGSRSYMGTSIGNLTGGEDTQGHWTDRTLKKLVLGGDESGKAFNGAGFKIEEVAIFVGSYLTASDVADYVFPTVTVDAAVTTMSALNTKIASLDNEFLYFSNAAVVTLDEEPSEATKAFLQGANWNGTVFIKDQNIENLDPTVYGNKDSTLKLSGVSGFWGATTYENTATPAIELEDSETEGKEYGFFSRDGYSFYAKGAYYYVHTPELKGSGTYKANTTGNGALFVADKFDNFTGKLNLEGKTVWLGTGAPEKTEDTWNNLVNFPGTVRLGSTIPANYSTWNVPNGYRGTVIQKTAANATETAFLTAAAWKGTCKMSWNPGNNPLDIVNYGNANSVIEITTNFGAYPTQNGGNDGAEVAAEVKIAEGVTWTVSNGWTAESYRTTFAKLSGAGSLTVNGTTSGDTAIPYTITRLEGFTGTLAGRRGQFTIGTIVAATEPMPGTKLVNCTTTFAPVLGNTEVYYNNAKVDDIELEFKAGDGIYVKAVAYVVFQQESGQSFIDVTNYYSTVSNAIDAAKAMKKTVVLIAQPEATDTYAIAAGETINVKKGEFTFDGIIFPEGAQYNNTTTETAGVTQYKCAVNTATIQYPGQEPVGMTGQLIQILGGLYSGYVPGYAGTVVTVLDGSDATLGDVMPEVFTYNSETHTYTLKTMVASYNNGYTTTYYPTVSNAVATVASGSTITLVENVALDESVEVAAGKNVTIDLNGKTVTGPAGGYVFANAGEVTITGNGTVTGAGGIAENTASDASVSIASGNYTATGDLFANVEGATIAVSGGTFNKSVADEYLAEGYEVTDNGNGTYGVREDKGWIYAAPGYWDYTGTWTEGAALGDDKVTISDGATYSNRTASAGQLVTVAMTLSFDDANDDDDDFGDAKAAIRLASGETDGTYQFQLYTSDGANKVWTNATVGVTATKEADYNFVFVLDLTNKTYTASVVTDAGATTNALSIGESVTEIPFACQGEITPVQEIDFVGAGKVSSIEGSYEDVPVSEGFVEDEVVTLDGGTATLTEAQAEWLNACGDKATVNAKIAKMDATAFNNAYLLNLNITGDFSYEFKVTDVEVGDAAVTVTVSLTRTGALAENEVAKPIVGTLKLKGTASLGTAFTVLGEAAVEFDADADFSDGATETTVTVDTTETDAKFYLPVIE